MENHNFLIGKPSNYFYGPSKNHGYVTNNQVGYMLVINQFPSSMILPLTNRVEMRRNTRAGALVGTLSASFPRPPCAASPGDGAAKEENSVIVTGNIWKHHTTK